MGWLIGLPDYAKQGPALVRERFLAAYRDSGGLVAGAPMPVGQFGCTQAPFPRPPTPPTLHPRPPLPPARLSPPQQAR